jgi:hypothetical protein
MDVSSESVPRKGLLSEKVSSLPSIQRSYIPELSELSWYPRKEEGNLQFGSNQVVLAKDARGAVAVDTAAAELVSES